MPSQTISGRSSIAEPVTYATEARFRALTDYTNQLDLPSDTLKRFLVEATEQVKRDAFCMQREELVTKDSEGRYFPAFKFFANKYGRSVNTGQVTAEDLTVYEAETSVTITTQLYAATSSRRILHNISSAIDTVDPFNNYFTLQSGYPTSNRQVVLTYTYCGKPLSEIIGYDKPLEQATIEQTIIKVLKWYKDKRLKKGTTTITLGSQTINRDETAFDELVKSHYDKYHEIINYIKPFKGRIFTIGRGSLINRPKAYAGGYKYN